MKRTYEFEFCEFCILPPQHHRPHHHGRLILAYLSKQGEPIMASTPLTVPAGTVTVYASQENYVDATGAATADVAVSGNYSVDNGATVVADTTGLTAVITLTGASGVTTVAWSGSNLAGSLITASNTITVEAPAVAPAVSADLVLATTPPPVAVPSAAPIFAAN